MKNTAMTRSFCIDSECDYYRFHETIYDDELKRKNIFDSRVFFNFGLVE